MTGESTQNDETNAWNPEIRSTLPVKYLTLSSMFRPANVFTSIDTANELADFTGLPIQQLICFRPERLLVHELLIRVSADIFVSDGSRYEDLGVNFREVVGRILDGYIAPNLDSIIARFSDLQKDCERRVGEQLAADLFSPPTTVVQSRGGFSLARLFGGKKAQKTMRSEPLEHIHQRILAGWKQRASAEDEALPGAIFASLALVANALIIKHGRIVGDQALLTSLVVGLVCNQYGSEIIGELITAHIDEAICTGCGVCAEICPSSAIRKEVA